MTNTEIVEGRVWEVGDVFSTKFWGESEVCIIISINKEYTFFFRCESIRSYETIKKDYCGASLEKYLFDRIQKTFIHHSQWYYEYRYNQGKEDERSKIKTYGI